MDLWNKAVSFHGHGCPGLAIGVKAAEAAIKTMKITFSEDEEIVCIAENSSCSVDGIQALLSCTIGKGNLIINNHFKQVFTFFDRKSGKGVRMYFSASPDARSRDEWLRYILTTPAEQLFTFSAPSMDMPPTAVIYKSFPCCSCGELTAEPALKEINGGLYCAECSSKV